jgi:uncharacterized repeat protein (TIGR04076 family)
MSEQRRPFNLSRKPSTCLKRREFCKTASWGAFGLLSSAALTGFGCESKGKFSGQNETEGKKESAMDKPIERIEAKVISQKGTCDLGHKVGDVVKFTETGVEGKICIHALYSMLPAVFAMLHEAHFPWLEDPDVKTHACPDAHNPLVFEIRRIRES